MANRNWASGGKLYSMHVMPVMAEVNVTIGASGAVASISGNLFASVVRTAQGVYTCTMQPLMTFSKLYNAIGSMQSPPSGLSGIMAIEIGNAPALGAPALVIVLKTLGASGALADPASGSIVSALLMLSNSSVPA
jgi:hypothetical protein